MNQLFNVFPEILAIAFTYIDYYLLMDYNADNWKWLTGAPGSVVEVVNFFIGLDRLLNGLSFTKYGKGFFAAFKIIRI